MKEIYTDHQHTGLHLREHKKLAQNATRHNTTNLSKPYLDKFGRVSSWGQEADQWALDMALVPGSLHIKRHALHKALSQCIRDVVGGCDKSSVLSEGLGAGIGGRNLLKRDLVRDLGSLTMIPSTEARAKYMYHITII